MVGDPIPWLPQWCHIHTSERQRTTRMDKTNVDMNHDSTHWESVHV